MGLALAGCAMHAEVARQPVDQTLMVSRNYQAVYADVLSQSRSCFRAGMAITPMASVMVDGQLYPDLGYGEVNVGIGGMMPGLTSVTKVSREGGRTRVEIKSANTGATAAQKDRGWIAYWARGGKLCPGQGQTEAPTNG